MAFGLALSPFEDGAVRLDSVTLARHRADADIALDLELLAVRSDPADALAGHSHEESERRAGLPPEGRGADEGVLADLHARQDRRAGADGRTLSDQRALELLLEK